MIADAAGMGDLFKRLADPAADFFVILVHGYRAFAGVLSALGRRARAPRVRT